MRVHRQGHQTISARQLWLIIAASRTAVITATLPVLTIGRAGRDAWIAATIATVGAMAFGLLLAQFVKPMQRQSFAEYSQKVLGKWLGGGATLVLIGLFTAAAYAQLRTFSHLVTVTALPLSPTWALAIVAALPPMFIAWRGLDGLGRAAEIVLSILALSFLLIFPLASVPELEWRWVLPMLEHGLGPVLTSVPVALVWFVVLTLGALSAYPHLDQQQRLPGILVVANLVPGVILILMAIATVGQFGPGEATSLLSPVYSLVKNLQIGGIVKRMEILAVATWVPSAGLAGGFMIWAGARLLSGITSLEIRHAALALGAIVLIGTGMPRPNMFELTKLSIAAALPTVAGIIGLLAVTWTVSLVRKPQRTIKRSRKGGPA